MSKVDWPHAIRQRRPFDQFHDERLGAVDVFEAVDVRDVGVIERGECPRFAFEAREAVGILRDGRRQHLDDDIASARGRLTRAPVPEHDHVARAPALETSPYARYLNGEAAVAEPLLELPVLLS